MASTTFAAGKRYAVCVGVENYKHPKLREPEPLKYAVDDAAALAEALQRTGFAVTLLTDDSGKDDPRLLPTKVNIQKRLAETLALCEADDTLLLAFAGHGLQFDKQKDAYFCPSDGQPFEDKTQTLVSIGQIYTDLDQSFAGVKVILFDACRNNPDPTRGRGGLDADSAPLPPRGVAALFSCSAGQKAFENDDLKHGVFFHHVLEGIAGEAANKRGLVTFSSLADHVCAAVPQTVRKLHPDRSQSPNMKADIVGASPVLARIEVSAPPLPRPTPQPMPQGAPQSGKPFRNSIGMRLAYIPAGTFEMGSDANDNDNEKPAHTVTISRPFYMGAYEVTIGEWLHFCQATGHQSEAEKTEGHGWNGNSGGVESFEFKAGVTPKEWGHPAQSDRHPVVNISWEDADAFCKWLSQKEGKRYRLPSEAEWEYACLAGSETEFSFGDENAFLLAQQGNLCDQSAKEAWGAEWSVEGENDGQGFTAKVGSYRANPFGLYDMYGNVSEWCSDWYNEKYYRDSPAEDPQGPTQGEERSYRGTSWQEAMFSTTYRSCYPPAGKNCYIGFRVVLVNGD